MSRSIRPLIAVNHGSQSRLCLCSSRTLPDLERALEPFAPSSGVMKVDEARNLLALAGTSQELATMLDVVKTFDVDRLAGMSSASLRRRTRAAVRLLVRLEPVNSTAYRSLLPSAQRLAV